MIIVTKCFLSDFGVGGCNFGGGGVILAEVMVDLSLVAEVLVAVMTSSEGVLAEGA